MIRQVRKADIPTLLEIENINFPELAADEEVLRQRVERIPDTFYVVEFEGQVIAYAEGTIIDLDVPLTPFFDSVEKNRQSAGYIFLTSVSVHPDFQRQGFGTLLLATFKELAVEKNREGLFLLCKEEKMSYYEMNGFSFKGLSSETFGGETWLEMMWENPQFKGER